MASSLGLTPTALTDPDLNAINLGLRDTHASHTICAARTFLQAIAVVSHRLRIGQESSSSPSSRSCSPQPTLLEEVSGRD